MRYRVPRNIVCTSFCSCAIGGMYIFSILLFLYSFSLSHTKHTNKHSFARTHTHTHKHTNTLYISIYISNSICFYFSFYHSYSLSLFLLLPFIFLSFIYVSPFCFSFFRRCVFVRFHFSHDFSIAVFRRFRFFFSPFFSFSLLLLLSLSFVITRTTNERFATNRLNSRQSIYYVILRFRSKDIHPVCVIYSFRENIACTFTFIPVHLCFVAASSIQTDPSPHK